MQRDSPAMAENKSENQSKPRTKIMSTLPLPLPVSLDQETLNDQYDLMVASLSSELLNSAPGKSENLERQALNRDHVHACNSSSVKIADTVSVVALASLKAKSLREERVALSDKYKFLRRKVTPARDPRLQANASHHSQFDTNSLHNGSMMASPSTNQPLKQRNWISQPSPQVDKPQPRKETYGEYKIRKEMEERRKATAAASSTEASTIVDGQTDVESKLECEGETNLNRNPFRIPKENSKTYREYRRRKEMEEAEKRKAATTTSPAATGNEIDEDRERDQKTTMTAMGKASSDNASMIEL